MEIKKELLGSKVSKGHLTIILEQTKECVSLCKKLKLDVFQEQKKDVKPRSKSK